MLIAFILLIHILNILMCSCLRHGCEVCCWCAEDVRHLEVSITDVHIALLGLDGMTGNNMQVRNLVSDAGFEKFYLSV